MVRNLVARVVLWAVPFKADAAWKTQNERLTELEEDFNVAQGKLDCLSARLGEYIETQVHG